MKRILISLQTVLLLLCLTVGHAAWADSVPDPYYGSDQQSDARLSMEELEDLVAPIALYPDPLIAQVLPAATFIDQINEAARYVREYGRYAQVDRQYWDVSVKAVAHYPDVLNMMDQKYDWTIALGQAFINQSDDVMYAIQLLRQDAREVGNLVSTAQQQVIVDNGYIRIIPAEPQVIYVPVYDPKVVYVERPSPGFGFITFGAALRIGVWLNRDTDWRDRRIYYHGWRGRDWIDRSRRVVQVQNNIYINNTNTVININKKVMQHDTSRYHEKIRQDIRTRRERHELPPSMRRDQRYRERSPKPGPSVKPIPGSGIPPRTDTHREQRLPENRPQDGKPAPVIDQQPHLPSSSPGHDRRFRERDQKQPQLPGESRPTGNQQPRTIIRDQKKDFPAPTRPAPLKQKPPVPQQATPKRIPPQQTMPRPIPAPQQAPPPHQVLPSAQRQHHQLPAPQQAPLNRAVPAQQPVPRPIPAPRQVPQPAPAPHQVLPPEQRHQTPAPHKAHGPGNEEQDTGKQHEH